MTRDFIAVRSVVVVYDDRSRGDEVPCKWNDDRLRCEEVPDSG
ncbi:hypothetical protein [Parabacteroides massiliensis]|nr:hypothetical protein [Parabacteroides massiliensis]